MIHKDNGTFGSSVRDEAFSVGFAALRGRGGSFRGRVSFSRTVHAHIYNLLSALHADVFSFFFFSCNVYNNMSQNECIGI